MMKKIALLFVLLMSSGMFGCKEIDKTDVPVSEVPAAVVTTFNTRYPGATGARWEKKRVNDHDVYEAEFKVNNDDKEVKIEENGTFIGEEDD
jgi:hypothetical protein